VGGDGALLWSETFDRRLEDIFAIQEEIALATVRALRVTLLASDAARLERRGTTNLAAYEFLLRGRQLMRREKAAEHRSAAEFFREAVRLDPVFAEAYAALASVIAHHRGQQDDASSLDEARSASLRALELAPGLAAAHAARAQVLQLDGRATEARAGFERARARSTRFRRALLLRPIPGDAGEITQARCGIAGRSAAIRPDDYAAHDGHPGIPGARRPRGRAARGRALVGRHQQATRDRSGRFRRLRPRGRCSTNSAALTRRVGSSSTLALRPDDPITHYNAACGAALAGEYEVALDYLERAIDLGLANGQWIMNDNDLVPLPHPRFIAIWRARDRRPIRGDADRPQSRRGRLSSGRPREGCPARSAAAGLANSAGLRDLESVSVGRPRRWTAMRLRTFQATRHRRRCGSGCREGAAHSSTARQHSDCRPAAAWTEAILDPVVTIRPAPGRLRP
jgi:tetratricopeptide (TPR) repeat protein